MKRFFWFFFLLSWLSPAFANETQKESLDNCAVEINRKAGFFSNTVSKLKNVMKRKPTATPVILENNTIAGVDSPHRAQEIYAEPRPIEPSEMRTGRNYSFRLKNKGPQLTGYALEAGSIIGILASPPDKVLRAAPNMIYVRASDIEGTVATVDWAEGSQERLKLKSTYTYPSKERPKDNYTGVLIGYDAQNNYVIRNKSGEAQVLDANAVENGRIGIGGKAAKTDFKKQEPVTYHLRFKHQANSKDLLEFEVHGFTHDGKIVGASRRALEEFATKLDPSDPESNLYVVDPSTVDSYSYIIASKPHPHAGSIDHWSAWEKMPQ